MKYFFSILILSLIISCNNSAKTTTPDQDIKTENTSSDPRNSRNYVFLTYKGAEVKTKTTTYLFQDGNKKEMVNIQVSNNPDYAKINVPSNFLNAEKTAANEDLIGKQVEWVYDKAGTGKVIAIKLSE